MIEKERLEELIEYEKKHIGDVFVFEVDGFQEINAVQINSDRDVCLNGKLCRMDVDKSLFYDEILLENLFEDEEEAKFVAKYHTTRVERFEPPTYEEFIDEDFYFYWFIAKSTQRARICKKDNSIFVELGVDENLYEFQLNKEGYIKAVEMAYKLFKGEE